MTTLTPAFFPTHKRPVGIGQADDNNDNDNDDDDDNNDNDDDNDNELGETTQQVSDMTDSPETTAQYGTTELYEMIEIDGESDTDKDTADVDSINYEGDDERDEFSDQSDITADQQPSSNLDTQLGNPTSTSLPRIPEETDKSNTLDDECKGMFSNLSIPALFFIWLSTNFISLLGYWAFRRMWRYIIEPRVAYCLNPHGEDERGLSRPRGWWFQQQQQCGFEMATRRPKPKMKRRPHTAESTRVTRSMLPSTLEPMHENAFEEQSSIKSLTPPPTPPHCRLHKDLFYADPGVMDVGSPGDTPRVTDSSETE